MKLNIVLLPVVLLMSIGVSACAADTTIQVSVPTLGTIGITVGRGPRPAHRRRLRRHKESHPNPPLVLAARPAPD